MTNFMLSFEKIYEEEIKLIQQKPGKRPNVAERTVGLCLSGGGVRAANFGLGILQALSDAGRLDNVDYLSTVSGGGYIGSAFSWMNHLQKPFNPKDLSFLRQRGAPMLGRITFLAVLAVFLRCIFLGIMVYLPLLALLIYATQTYYSYYLYGAIGTGVLFGVSSLLYSLVTYFRGAKNLNADYRLRTTFLHFQGWLFIAALVLFALWSIHPLAQYLESLHIAAITASFTTVIGYAGLIFRSIQKSLLIAIGSTLAIYGILLFAYMTASLEPNILYGLALFSCLLGYFANINLTGLHRDYRDALMEVYLPNPASVEKDRTLLATMADSTPLSTMCNAKTPGPYQIYNCTVGLFNSKNPQYGGRGGDNFIFSPLYCGSTATGWQSTSTYMNDTMNSATAMAISGAAVNPRLSNESYPELRLPMLGFLMSLLNIRLGYWVPNPMYKKSHKPKPNCFSPGLLDIFSMGHKETSPLLELSDGGGFDNTAFYELVRRKVKVIILSDAGTQPGVPFFRDLGLAFEFVRSDFGAEVVFDNPDYPLQDILATQTTPLPFPTAKRGFAIGSIHYSDGSTGTLLYIHTTLIADLPPELIAYKYKQPDFPVEPTTNQFFNEQQFEAYRTLAYLHTTRILALVDDQYRLKSSKI